MGGDTHTYMYTRGALFTESQIRWPGERCTRTQSCPLPIFLISLNLFALIPFSDPGLGGGWLGRMDAEDTIIPGKQTKLTDMRRG